VFVSYFSAKGMSVSVHEARLIIHRNGSIPKFVERVDQLTFNAELAMKRGAEVIYVTERAVFRLMRGGLVLTEIAPGVDLERDVLAAMGFVPSVEEDLHQMEKAIFVPGRLNLRSFTP
jgi:propionate CoA-transferase